MVLSLGSMLLWIACEVSAVVVVRIGERGDELAVIEREIGHSVGWGVVVGGFVLEETDEMDARLIWN